MTNIFGDFEFDALYADIDVVENDSLDPTSFEPFAFTAGETKSENETPSVVILPQEGATLKSTSLRLPSKSPSKKKKRFISDERRVLNRESARRSRLKKKAYIEELRKNNEKFEEDNRHLQELVAAREAEIERITKLLNEKNEYFSTLYKKFEREAAINNALQKKIPKQVVDSILRSFPKDLSAVESTVESQASSSPTSEGCIRERRRSFDSLNLKDEIELVKKRRLSKEKVKMSKESFRKNVLSTVYPETMREHAAVNEMIILLASLGIPNASGLENARLSFERVSSSCSGDDLITDLSVAANHLPRIVLDVVAYLRKNIEVKNQDFEVPFALTNQVNQLCQKFLLEKGISPSVLESAFNNPSVYRYVCLVASAVEASEKKSSPSPTIDVGSSSYGVTSTSSKNTPSVSTCVATTTTTIGDGDSITSSFEFLSLVSKEMNEYNSVKSNRAFPDIDYRDIAKSTVPHAKMSYKSSSTNAKSTTEKNSFEEEEYLKNSKFLNSETLTTFPNLSGTYKIDFTRSSGGSMPDLMALSGFRIPWFKKVFFRLFRAKSFQCIDHVPGERLSWLVVSRSKLKAPLPKKKTSFEILDVELNNSTTKEEALKFLNIPFHGSCYEDAQMGDNGCVVLELSALPTTKKSKKKVVLKGRKARMKTKLFTRWTMHLYMDGGGALNLWAKIVEGPKEAIGQTLHTVFVKVE
eukprot:g1618.t1